MEVSYRRKRSFGGNCLQKHRHIIVRWISNTHMQTYANVNQILSKHLLSKSKCSRCRLSSEEQIHVATAMDRWSHKSWTVYSQSDSAEMSVLRSHHSQLMKRGRNGHTNWDLTEWLHRHKLGNRAHFLHFDASTSLESIRNFQDAVEPRTLAYRLWNPRTNSLRDFLVALWLCCGRETADSRRHVSLSLVLQMVTTNDKAPLDHKTELFASFTFNEHLLLCNVCNYRTDWLSPWHQDNISKSLNTQGCAADAVDDPTRHERTRSRETAVLVARQRQLVSRYASSLDRDAVVDKVFSRKR